MTGRSENYRFTVPNSPAGWLAITMFRVATKRDNKTRKPGTPRKSVALYPRLGQDSPHRALYADGGPLHSDSSQRIKVEHSTRIDVYAFDVSTWNYRTSSYPE